MWQSSLFSFKNWDDVRSDRRPSKYMTADEDEIHKIMTQKLYMGSEGLIKAWMGNIWPAKPITDFSKAISFFSLQHKCT